MVPFRRAFVLVCFTATILGATGPANATPGALDPAFGSGGLVTTDVGGNLNSAADGSPSNPMAGSSSADQRSSRAAGGASSSRDT
jgi:hypothetical protein